MPITGIFRKLLATEDSVDSKRNKSDMSTCPQENKAKLEKPDRNQASKGRNRKNNKVPQNTLPSRNKNTTRKKAIKPEWHPDMFDVPLAEDKTRFHDFDLPDELMHGIFDLGFKYCTPIQAEILSHTLQGKDAVGKAQTGTGKTAAFLITAIKLLLEIPPPAQRYLGETRVVIIAPTRELVLQIGEDAKALTKYTNLRTVMLVGGVDVEKQKAQLEKGFVDILIATPGRLLDFISRREVFLDLTETLVLDEADRMLDMGFIPQVRRIVLETPRVGDRQTLFFSATFTDDILRLTDQWTWHPVNVEIAAESAVIDTIDQKIYMVTAKDKYKTLYNLITQKKLNKVIIFANRRYETRKIAELLQKDGVKADYISGDVPQKKRISTLEKFKSGKINVLVATDVAGRGIHIEGVSHVINYNLPEDAEDYVHRVGRTGRAGTEGVSVSFACEDDAFLIDELEEKLGKKLTLSFPPDDFH